MEFYEKTLSVETVYEGTVIKVERLTVELPNGNRATRDIVRNHGASVVVPIINDEIILVQQFRKAADREFWNFLQESLSLMKILLFAQTGS